MPTTSTRNNGQHHRIFGDVLALVLPPQLAKEMGHVRTSTYTVNLTRLSTVENSLYWIDVDDVDYRSFVCEKDMNPDFHAYEQGDGGQDQRTVEVDDEKFRLRMSKAHPYQAPQSESSGEPVYFFGIHERRTRGTFRHLPLSNNSSLTAAKGRLARNCVSVMPITRRRFILDVISDNAR